LSDHSGNPEVGVFVPRHLPRIGRAPQLARFTTYVGVRRFQRRRPSGM